MNKRVRVVSLLLLTAAGSCASTGEDGGEPELVIPITVENDLTNRGDVSVRIIASTGVSSLLGGAPPASSRMFSYRDRLLSGTYRLRAETGDGRTFESRPFTLFPGASVVWELQRNVLQVFAGEVMEFASEATSASLWMTLFTKDYPGA